MGEKLFRGQILDFLEDPGVTETTLEALRYLEDGALVTRADGCVLEVGPYALFRAKYPGAAVHDYTGRLIMPGFIDTHIHFPQMQIIASYGRQLLDWLTRYTFPAEAQFQNAALAKTLARDFVRELLANGTTTCLAFAAESAVSAEALFEAAIERNMRMISGKVLMNRNAPAVLKDSAAEAYTESEALIRKWHKRGRCLYAITPRFAISCDMEELKMAGRLHAEYPDTYIQTHISENRDEVATTLGLFPGCRDYLEIYEQAGIVKDRSVFAHGIFLSDSELDRLASTGASIAHCPTSNLFLGSGLYDLRRAKTHGVVTSIATDVGAGTSFSLLQTLNEAYKVQQLQGCTLDPLTAFYMITLGAARTLKLEDKIGSLAVGSEADFVVIDYQAQHLQALRMQYLQRTGHWNLENLLFGLMILGDARNIEATYLMGVDTASGIQGLRSA